MPRLQMTEAEYRLTSASTATHALDWGACASHVLVVTSRDDELFSLCRYSSEVRAVETTAPAPGTDASPEDRALYGAIRSVNVSV